MSSSLEGYRAVTGNEIVDQLYQLAKPLKGIRVLHVNSTKEGGGVAEILRKMVPLMEGLGIDAQWEVISGDSDFFECTKGFHNSLQGKQVTPSDELLRHYQEVNSENADKLRPLLEEADVVFIHDPQPLTMIQHVPKRKGKWVWRCHIDVSKPHRPVWRYLKPWVEQYDASVFSLASFAKPLNHPQFLITPSIDPLSEKNMNLPKKEVDRVFEKFRIDRERPVILQVSRFDRFKDPIGVIEAYRLVKKMVPLQLILAGGGASDDPEGMAVLEEVKHAAAGDPDIHILHLPPDAHLTINALQRGADVVLQKSTKEGFGLTVTEAMWKGKPVIGGDTGGIRVQVYNHYTGFLVRSPEGAALRIRYLLHREDKRREMGERAKRLVRENFLITHHLRGYLALMINLLKGGDYHRIEVGV